MNPVETLAIWLQLVLIDCQRCILGRRIGTSSGWSSGLRRLAPLSVHTRAHQPEYRRLNQF